MAALPNACAADEPPAVATESAASAAVDAAEKQQGDAASSDENKTEPAAEAAKPSEDAPPADEAKGSKSGDSTERKQNAAESTDKPTEKPTEAAESKAKSETNSKPKTAAQEKRAVPKRDKVRIALLTLKEELAETSGQVGPFQETQLDLREAISRLEKAAKDKSIKGIVLDLQNPAIGRGKVDELRGAITRFRKAGKKAYAMMETAMPTDYLVACACDEIVMPETGIVLLPGIHAEATFYKGLLAKLGIEADFIHIGDYKGAAEPLMREKFSEPVRENMTSLIDSLYDDLVTTIVKDRPLSISQAKEIIDTGLLTATRAKQLGLIDRVAYVESLRDELAKTYDAEPLVFVQNYGQKKVDTDFSGPMGLIKLMQAMMGGGASSGDGKGKKIAVVYAIGPIMSGKSENGIFGQIMGSTTIVDALRKANDDKQVAAIVLRIDSPGGSAIASDLIWNQTQVIEKPIVASMSDVAASGGYYIAMGADKIVATPGTITGSIGVVGGKLAIRGLYDKIGITTETIERGRNSGIFASSGKWTDSQRAVVKAMMEDIYDQFTAKAAKGRNMPLEKLRALAGGRVYSGRQAKENGLVDQLGTLDDAIDEAKKLAGLEEDADVKIEVLPEPINFFETLFGDLDAEKEVRLGQGLEAAAPELIEVARRAYRLRRVFDQPAALVMPFELDIR
ncbi:MAG: signal peptide peptidase SppA [Pirellulales bacterium]